MLYKQQKINLQTTKNGKKIWTNAFSSMSIRLSDDQPELVDLKTKAACTTRRRSIFVNSLCYWRSRFRVVGHCCAGLYGFSAKNTTKIDLDHGRRSSKKYDTCSPIRRSSKLSSDLAGYFPVQLSRSHGHSLIFVRRGCRLGYMKNRERDNIWAKEKGGEKIHLKV